MKYFSLFSIIFHFSAASAEFCEPLFSGQTAETIEQVLKQAEKKLEGDLKSIRNSPQEPFLKKFGFSLLYYTGVDQAREFRRVRKYLLEIKADPEKTHIPYFADQINKTIIGFEKGFKYQNQHKLMYEEHLKLLEDYKKEAYQRMRDLNVTYIWWADFNYKLSTLGNPLRRYDAEKRGFANFITTQERPDPPKNSDFESAKDLFPKEVMFFTIGPVGIMAFNRIGKGSHFISVSGKDMTADGIDTTSAGFFHHDVVHLLRISKDFESYWDAKPAVKYEEIEGKLNSISNKFDQEKAELALFLFKHEGGLKAYLDQLNQYTKIRRKEASHQKKREIWDRAVSRFLYVSLNAGFIKEKLVPYYLRGMKSYESEMIKFTKEIKNIFDRLFYDDMEGE